MRGTYRIGRGSLAFAALVAAFFDAAPAEGLEQWDRGFVYPGVDIGATETGSVNAFLWHNAPNPLLSGLFVGGNFTTVSRNKPANNIAKWNGTRWEALGSGTNGIVRAIAFFDPIPDDTLAFGELYVAGDFTTAGGVSAGGIATWNGSTWSTLGSGLNGTVRALAEFNDVLYVGGGFTTAGGLPAEGIAGWDDLGWRSVGAVSGTVYDLQVFDDGTGPALFVAGTFFSADSTSANNIAKWDGNTWSALGSGTNNGIFALEIFEGELYAGGSFTTAGGANANHLAKWNGSSWSAVGGGVNGPVNALLFHLDGPEPRLFIGGSFTMVEAVSAQNIAEWLGDEFRVLGGVDNSVIAFGLFDDGGGATVYAGGTFARAINESGQERVDRLAILERPIKLRWGPLGQGTETGILALAPAQPCGCGAVYAAGGFFQAGGTETGQILVAEWRGSSWKALGTGFNNIVSALYAFPDAGSDCEPGPTTVVYAGGAFSAVDGQSAQGIARWDGQAWAPVGGGIGGMVESFTRWGGDLYAGGLFGTAGGSPASCVARWDGAIWTPLGSGMNSGVNALAVFDNGTGDALYASGNFTMAGGVTAKGIAKWNGATWSSLFPGILGIEGTVYAIAEFGGELYVGGSFNQVGFATINNIAKWNGTSWSAVGGGTNNPVLALTTHNGALYAGGTFTTAGGAPASRIAKWDGAGWSSVEFGVDGSVHSLTAGGFGTSKLFVGGTFQTAGGDICASNIVTLTGFGSRKNATTCSVDPTAVPDPRPADPIGGDRPMAAASIDFRGLLLSGGAAAFDLSLTRAAPVNLAVYDVTGRCVTTVFEGFREAGRHRFELGRASAATPRLASGIYFGLVNVSYAEGTVSRAARVALIR